MDWHEQIFLTSYLRVMGRHDWYRNEDWNDAIEAEFRDRLARARERGQYLRIQGSTLAASTDDRLVRVGLELIDESVARFPERYDFNARNTYLIRARALAKLGLEDEALLMLRAALQLGPSLDAPLDFLQHVVRRKLREHYEEARRIATDAIAHELMPTNIFEYNCAVAMIADELGDEDSARNHALWALDAFDERRSPFWRHPGLGLVRSVAVDRFLEIERLASTASDSDREFRPDRSSSRVPFKVFQRRMLVASAYRVTDDARPESRIENDSMRARMRRWEDEAADLNLEIKRALPGVDSYKELEYYPLQSIAVAFPILLRWVKRIESLHHVASISDFLVRASVPGAAPAIGAAYERLAIEVNLSSDAFAHDLRSIAQDLVRSKPPSNELLRLARLAQIPMSSRHYLIAELVSRKVKSSIDFVDELLDDRSVYAAAILGLRIVRSFRLENKRQRAAQLGCSTDPEVRKAVEKTLAAFDTSPPSSEDGR